MITLTQNTFRILYLKMQLVDEERCSIKLSRVNLPVQRQVSS